MKYLEYVAARKARGFYVVPEDQWNHCMGRGEYEPDPRIYPYLYALLHDSPYVSSSHNKLREINSEHGEITVAALLVEHWRIIAEQKK